MIASRQVLLVATLFLAAATAGAQAGSQACARCHGDIYDSYRQTPMASSSGIVTLRSGLETFGQARFTDERSGVTYAVRQNRTGIALEFSKSGSYSGRKALAYFVGSGATARSYLLAEEGYLYEAPVAYYAQTHRWALAPGYDTYAYPYLTRPVTPACLACHASLLQPLSRTLNRYAAPAFREPGIGCERCHGPGGAHIAKMGTGAIVNPAKLAPANRDSICSQCHLSGNVRVMAAGKSWNSYQPGGRLADSMTVLVKSGAPPGMIVNGHMEALAQSGCKRNAGDRMWCGSCHDPHRVPTPSGRAAWFREKCLACHADRGCTEHKAMRAARQDDCAACHMPKRPVTDAQHVVYTDHSIPRRARSTDAQAPPDADLVAFDGSIASERDLALAYAIAAPRERSSLYRTRALAMLEKAERANPDDTEVLLYLAELYRSAGQADAAIPLYRRAIELDPAQVTGSVGLGGIMMERGDFQESIRLWEDALSKNAGLELVRTNLAVAYWRSGDSAAAERQLVKAVELNPGFAAPADLLRRLRDQK